MEAGDRASGHEGEVTMRRAIIGALIALAAVHDAPSRAQDAYPSKPITMIVPFAAGGSTDVIGRVIAEGLRQVLGQPVLVDNRGGAGGSIGTLAIARAQPDGYTIGMGTASTLAINPAAYKSLPFDVLTDLSPIGNIAAVPNIMTINPSVAAADMASFIALARAQPRKLSYASAGDRLGEPPARRAVQAGDRHRPLARAVSRRRSCAQRRGRRPGPGDVRQPADLAAARAGWPAAAARRVRRQARRGAAERADLRRAQARRHELDGVFRPCRAEGNAGADRASGSTRRWSRCWRCPTCAASSSAQQAIVVGNSPAAFRAEIERELARMRRAAAAAKIELN